MCVVGVGDEVLGLRLAPGYLSFLNASQLVDRVEARMEEAATHPLAAVILELAEVEGVTGSGLQAIKELL